MVCSDTWSEARFGLCDCVQVDDEREGEVGSLHKTWDLSNVAQSQGFGEMTGCESDEQMVTILDIIFGQILDIIFFLIYNMMK